LGDITESNPEIRANGGTVDTNLTNISPKNLLAANIQS